MICDRCSNALTDPLPVASYDDHPFFLHAGADIARWRGYSRQIIDFLARTGRTKGKLLDVGSSHGLLLEAARERGWQAEGIEPSQAAVSESRRRGLRVTHGYLAEGVFEPSTFDVIVLSHVVEHVLDATALLATARTLLRPGGVVCLCQTNYEGTIPRWFGRRWDYWVEHEHYYHFSRAGIEVLLERAGLELEQVELLPLGYHPDFHIDSPRAIPGTVLRLVKTAVTRLSVGFPFVGDQMYVLAHAR